MEGQLRMTEHILLVDEDEGLRQELSLGLQGAGFRASTADSVEDALTLMRRDPPDLILLDIGLPGIDGLEALWSLEQALEVPVILLAAPQRALDEVLGLELGAADYVTKPFSTEVLLARIRAALRRARRPRADMVGPEPLVVGDLVIDRKAHQVTVAGRSVTLSPREFDLLLVLARQAGKVLSLDDLLVQVWGAEYNGEPQVVYVHIHWLREKLEEDIHHPRRILTVHGVGYRLQPQHSQT
jgi:DNA-binding response OmpR family regulator